MATTISGISVRKRADGRIELRVGKHSMEFEDARALREWVNEVPEGELLLRLILRRAMARTASGLPATTLLDRTFTLDFTAPNLLTVA